MIEGVGLCLERSVKEAGVRIVNPIDHEQDEMIFPRLVGH